MNSIVETQIGQVELIDEDVDYAYRVGIAYVVAKLVGSTAL
jgi:hypothetical protein